MYFLAFHRNESDTRVCHCVNGSTNPDSCPSTAGGVSRKKGDGGTWMTYTDGNPDGPWSDPVLIFQPGQWGEPYPDGTNLAVTTHDVEKATVASDVMVCKLDFEGHECSTGKSHIHIGPERKFEPQTVRAGSDDGHNAMRLRRAHTSIK